jgi:hypothetical protein
MLAEQTIASCSRCGRRARAIAWSEAESRYVHSSVTRHLDDEILAFCGGTVTVPGKVPRMVGDVVACFPASGEFTLHMVRLEAFGNRRNGSWRGSALCGKTYRRSPHWIPADELPEGVVACEACREREAG